MLDPSTNRELEYLGRVLGDERDCEGRRPRSPSRRPVCIPLGESLSALTARGGISRRRIWFDLFAANGRR